MTERRADDNTTQRAQHHISCKTASTYFIRGLHLSASLARTRARGLRHWMSSMRIQLRKTRNYRRSRRMKFRCECFMDSLFLFVPFFQLFFARSAVRHRCNEVQFSNTRLHKSVCVCCAVPICSRSN